MSRVDEIKTQIAALEAELGGLAPYERMGARELARQAGISPSTASRFKAGKNIDMESAQKLLPFVTMCPCCGQKLPPETQEATAPPPADREKNGRP